MNHMTKSVFLMQGAGTAGVNFFDSNNCGVRGCNITDIGGSGATFVGGGNRTSLQVCAARPKNRIAGMACIYGITTQQPPGGMQPSLNVIRDSTISWFQRACFTYNDGAAIDTGGIIEFNEISSSPHAGLSINGNDIVVQYNIVHETVQSTFDNAGSFD